jgi:hypothetical protein
VSSLDVACIAAWPEVRSARAIGAAAGKADAAAEAAVDDAAVGAAMAAMPSAAAGDRGRGSADAGPDGGDRIEIVADAAEPVVRRLLAEDPTLSDLEVQRAGLAEAFIELTRDDADVAPATQREAA